MSLKYALLTVLSYRSLSGYDLITYFDGSVGNVWHATHPQIYRELDRLRRARLASQEVVVQRGRPNKKVYSLTAKGRRDLLAWVASPPEMPKQKDSLLVRAFSYGRIDPEAAVGHITQRRAFLEQGLGQLRLLRETTAGWSDDALRTGSLLTITAGIMYGEGYIRWCDWAIDFLQRPRGGRSGKAQSAPSERPSASKPKAWSKRTR